MSHRRRAPASIIMITTVTMILRAETRRRLQKCSLKHQFESLINKYTRILHSFPLRLSFKCNDGLIKSIFRETRDASHDKAALKGLDALTFHSVSSRDNLPFFIVLKRVAPGAQRRCLQLSVRRNLRSASQPKVPHIRVRA